MKPIPCSNTLGIHTTLYMKQIFAAKDFMKAKYNNTYELEPHITHLLFPMFETNFKELRPELINFVSNLQKFKIKIGDIEIDEKRKFFTIPTKGEKLENLHRDLLELANPFRQGAVRDKDIERLNQGRFTAEQIEYLNTYGYPRVLNFNHPHITIGSCENENRDLTYVKTELQNILKNIINSEYEITELEIMLHTNAKVQSDMKILFAKKIVLNK